MKRASKRDLQNAPDWVKESMFEDFSPRIGSDEELEPMTFWDGVIVLAVIVAVTLVVLGVLDMLAGVLANASSGA